MSPRGRRGARRASAPGGASLAALTGAAAIVGHIYPVWLRFHGGKGRRGRGRCLQRAVAGRHRVRRVAVSDHRLGRRATCRSARSPPPSRLPPVAWWCRRAASGRDSGGRHRRADPLPAPRQPAPPSRAERERQNGSARHEPHGGTLGAGSWGTALAMHLAREGRTRAPVGARRRARRTECRGRRATPAICRTCRCPPDVMPTVVARRRAGRRGSSSSSRCRRMDFAPSSARRRR